MSISPFMNDHCEYRAAALNPDQLHPGGLDPVSIHLTDRPEPFQCAAVITIYCHAIDLFHLCRWMHQPVGQRSVVGEQQKPLRVAVQTAHRVDACATVLYQICHSLSAALILQGRHIAPWLM